MKYIITSGPMEMEIDNVRKVKNSSTGKLGSVFAEVLIAKGKHDIVYIHTAGSVVPKGIVKKIQVEDHQQLLEVLNTEITDTSVVIHAMAVSDFSYGGSADINQITRTIYDNLEQINCEDDIKNLIVDTMQKSSKLSSSSNQLLLLNQADKIIDAIKTINPDVKLVGFKLLANVDKEELLTVARNMKERAGCDLVVANKKEQVHDNEHKAYIITNEKVVEANTKRQIAEMVIEEMEQR